MTDEQRERLIESYRVLLELEPDSDAKYFAMIRMKGLIGERTPGQIERMEHERGLRAP